MRVSAVQLQRVAILGGTFIAGAFFGWTITKKNAVAMAENEIAAAKEFYQAKYEKLAEEDAQATDDVEQLTLDLGYTDTRMPSQHVNYSKASKVPDVVNNQPDVVANADIVGVEEIIVEERLEWDYESETGKRDPSIPYIIHRDEFENARATGFTQVAYVYYEDDDILVDEGDSIITDKYALIGMDTLDFGHGSGNPMIVYIRNERIQMDFEVNLVRDSYEHAVLGFEPEAELRHSEQYRGRRRGFED